MKALNLAFAGFRHVHILDLYERARAHPSVRVSGTWDSNPEAATMDLPGVTFTHHSFEALLADADAVAIGDCYGRRGALAIQALRAGKHVITDKPLCTTKVELREIQDLVHDRPLAVGLMLDLRDHANWIGLREVIRSGQIGDPQTLSFSAQHPLRRSTRPSWYFEAGMHGGTLNDIAIHAVDFIPWLTGLSIREITAARTWNAKALDTPHFHDCGHCMLRLENGAGVLGDVSYLAPDTCGYDLDMYWRVTVHGTRGVAEISYTQTGMLLAGDSHTSPTQLPAPEARPGGYLQDFLDEIAGHPRPEGLHTGVCLNASEWALALETAASRIPPSTPNTP